MSVLYVSGLAYNIIVAASLLVRSPPPAKYLVATMTFDHFFWTCQPIAFFLGSGSILIPKDFILLFSVILFWIDIVR